MKILTVSQIKSLDYNAIHEYEIPGLDLMEKAGTGVADAICRYGAQGGGQDEIWIMAGKGNNGGDAFVAARKLLEYSFKIRLFTIFNPDLLPACDARKMFFRLRHYNFPAPKIITQDNLASLHPERCAMIVDGLLGTGLHDEISGIARKAVEWINLSGKPVISIDVPSGLNADTGKMSPVAVKADVTVTLGMPKRGFFLNDGPACTGKLHVADIGIPRELSDLEKSDIELITARDLPLNSLVRGADAHKGTCGHTLVVGARPGMTGAVALAARAAARSGSGLVTAAVPEGLNPVMEAKLTEAMTLALPQSHDGAIGEGALDVLLEKAQKCSSVVIGCGMGTGRDAEKLLRGLIARLEKPMVIDADGLNLLAQDKTALKSRKADIILTPHPGEMSQLTGSDTRAIQEDRVAAARTLCDGLGVIVALKGSRTVVAAPGEAQTWINPTGNPGMATGGSGDVLAGITGSFLAQGMRAADAARSAVYIHGLAADMRSVKHGETGMLASDITETLPAAIEFLTGARARRNFWTE